MVRLFNIKKFNIQIVLLVAIFISGLLVSFTGYALYTAFGQPSQQLRDPFEEHGD
ncbi:putative photosystem II PsbN [Helianthus annuus]|nr:putative photosystem II PsbN [Helianthus annuus]